MKIKLDENLPAALAAELRGLGHDVDTAADEGLVGRPDADLRDAADVAGRLLITQDLDFSDARQLAGRESAGVLLERLAEPSRRRLTRRVAEVLATEDADAWVGRLVVVTDRKIRVRRA